MAMYTDYFSLAEAPFSIAPDPRYLFMSERHREALAHLLFGVRSEGGFVLLTGEVGTGKTTICRCLLDQLPADIVVAFIINPRLTVRELLSTICDELRINYPPDNKSIKIFVDLINGYLLDAHARGRRAVLIIDEAQNLSKQVLEQIRLLTNLETDKRKLLQIILIGQPELGEKLALPELRQLSQRIIARYHLGKLTKEEVASYVKHRLSLARSRVELFSPSALRAVFRHSGGIPRLVNLICDRALLGAYALGKRGVDRTVVNRAAREVLGETQGGTRHRGMPVWYLAGALIMLLGAASAAAYYYGVGQRLPVARTQLSTKDGTSQLATLRKPVPAATPESEVEHTSLADVKEASAARVSTELPTEAAQQPREESTEHDTGRVDILEAAQNTSRMDITETEQATSRADALETRQTTGPAVTMETDQDTNPVDAARAHKAAVQNTSVVKLAEIARRHDSASAHRTLFRQWRADYEPQKGDARSQAESQGLHYFSGQGSSDELKQWNRPVMLELSEGEGEGEGEGEEIHATLTALREGTAVFTFDDETVTVSAEDVFKEWSGKYTLLRRGLPKFSSGLRVGKKGESVAWLKSQFARLQGEPLEDGASDVFDEALAEKVKRFQQANGLQSDGIVGWQTLTRLIAEANNDAPVLMENKKGP